MLPLNDMALFVEVGRALNFKKASQLTGTPVSTLSRRIKQLEKSIGLRLFNRSTRSIELTEAGQMYFDQCRPIVDEARTAHNELSQEFSEPKGVLSASLAVDFTATYITPLLPEFCARYPDISFDFDLSSAPIKDMSQNYYDLIIRVGEQTHADLHRQLLGYLPLHLYASPDYIQTHGAPESPEELMNRECLTIIYTHWELFRGRQKTTFEAKSKFQLNSLGMVKKLVTLGMGIALMPKEFVEHEISQGLLVRIMKPWRGMNAPVYAMTESATPNLKTKTFIDFLAHKLQQTEAD